MNNRNRHRISGKISHPRLLFFSDLFNFRRKGARVMDTSFPEGILIGDISILVNRGHYHFGTTPVEKNLAR